MESDPVIVVVFSTISEPSRWLTSLRIRSLDVERFGLEADSVEQRDDDHQLRARRAELSWHRG